MDLATFTQQLKVMKKKAKDAKAAGKKELAVQFKDGASRLWRKVRRLTPKAKKAAEG